MRRAGQLRNDHGTIPTTHTPRHRLGAAPRRDHHAGLRHRRAALPAPWYGGAKRIGSPLHCNPRNRPPTDQLHVHSLLIRQRTRTLATGTEAFEEERERLDAMKSGRPLPDEE